MKNKKNRKNRLLALVLAVLMTLPMFVGCADKNDWNELKIKIETEQTNQAPQQPQASQQTQASDLSDIRAQIDTLNQNLATANASLKQFEEQIHGLEAQNADLKKDLQERNAALETANARAATAESKVAELEALVASLKEQVKPIHQIYVINDEIWVHIEDFLYAANGVGALIAAQDGSGYALRMLKGVRVKVYDDEHGDEHLVPNFDLPMQDYYTIVLTADEGKTAFTANFGNYNWINQGLVTSFEVCSFAKDLTSMPKNGGAGKQFYSLLSAVADVVEENGMYRFAVNAGEYGANPVIKPTCQHGSGCHCGNCDKCPALEPIVKTETVTVEKVVEKIVEVPGETIYIPGETIYVPGETVYLPGETVYEKIKYCGKCDNLLEDCTCSDSDHNDLEEVPNPNEPTDGVKPGHNELEEIPNPNGNGNSSSTHTPSTGGSNHSGLGSSSGRGNASAHSPLD